MEGSSTLHRALRWSLVALAVVLTTVAALAAVLASVDAQPLRGAVVRFIATRTGRQIRIDGPLKAHLLSLHPSLTAEHVTIGNPPWAPPGSMAELGKLTVVFDLPWLSQPFAIRRLEMEGADLHLRRDAAGHANWHWQAPGILPGKGAPIIHSLSMPAAHVELDDDRRHLLFDGIVSAQDTHAANGTMPLRIEGKGHLNSREATFTIDGDPLATVSREASYHFTFDEHSSGSQLSGHGLLARPFDFRMLDATFEANGPDLKDLYFLVGVRLPNTGIYRLSGKLARRGTRFELTDLLATSGHSDMHGTLTSQLENGRSHLDIDLYSQVLRLSDLGARAAGRATEPPGAKQLLLPETEIRLDGIRRSDSVVNFHAREVDVGKVLFHTVVGKMTIEHGIVALPLLSGALPDGKVTAHIKFDAKTDIPTASLDVNVVDLRLEQLDHKDPEHPPLDGLLQGRLTLTGRGRSIHELAASANGTVTAVLPHGAIRASLAELTGIDLRGLGLLITRNKKETPIRCAVASFEAHDGNLTAQTLVIDTDRMVITGSGSIQLDSEALDLQIHGEPKQLRLFRLHAPIVVRGTLAHPSIAIGASHLEVKAGEAADCAALLTAAPLTAK